MDPNLNDNLLCKHLAEAFFRKPICTRTLHSGTNKMWNSKTGRHPNLHQTTISCVCVLYLPQSRKMFNKKTPLSAFAESFNCIMALQQSCEYEIHKGKKTVGPRPLKKVSAEKYPSCISSAVCGFVINDMSLIGLIFRVRCQGTALGDQIISFLSGIHESLMAWYL